MQFKNFYSTLFLFLSSFLSLFSLLSAFDPNAVSHTTKIDLLSSIEKGTEKFLIYFYTKFDECPKCKEFMPLFQEAAGYLDKLEEDQIRSYKLAVKLPEFGVTTFPQLLFFDGKFPFRYDNPDNYQPDDIVDWIEEAKETPIPELNDETFEHLTQASSGSTTGDWLILFSNSKRPECMKPILPDVATVASRLRRRKNIATLCTASNPNTAKRFGFDPDKHCSKFLFFHRTDLYYYEEENINAKDLLKFVMEGYKNQEAKTVPQPYSESDAELQSTVMELSQMMMDHVRSSTLMFCCGVAITLLIIFFTFSLILSKIRTKKLA